MAKRKKKKYVIVYYDLTMGKHRGQVTAENVRKAGEEAERRYGKGSISNIYRLKDWKYITAIRGKERRIERRALKIVRRRRK